MLLWGLGLRRRPLALGLVNAQRFEKTMRVSAQTLYVKVISPTHKRTEGRAPVWGSEFTSKRRRTTGGVQHKPL
jgi:hypothetical protein